MYTIPPTNKSWPCAEVSLVKSTNKLSLLVCMLGCTQPSRERCTACGLATIHHLADVHQLKIQLVNNVDMSNTQGRCGVVVIVTATLLCCMSS